MAGGHLIDIMEILVNLFIIKNISVQFMHIVYHKEDMNQRFDDIGNAFTNAYKNEKVFVKRAGSEFVEHEGKVIIIQKDFFVIFSSSEKLHSRI